MNKWLSIAVAILASYEEIATGGAKAEADKLLALAIQLGTSATPPAA